VLSKKTAQFYSLLAHFYSLLVEIAIIAFTFIVSIFCLLMATAIHSFSFQYQLFTISISILLTKRAMFLIRCLCGLCLLLYLVQASSHFFLQDELNVNLRDSFTAHRYNSDESLNFERNNFEFESTWYGVHPLHKSSRNGDVEMATYLIKQGIDVDQKDLSSLSAIHYAAIYGRIDILHLLIDAGADLHAQTDQGSSALHLAFIHKNFKFARELTLTYNISIVLKDNGGMKAFDYDVDEDDDEPAQSDDEPVKSDNEESFSICRS
jgi:hypothetical protein